MQSSSTLYIYLRDDLLEVRDALRLNPLALRLLLLCSRHYQQDEGSRGGASSVRDSGMSPSEHCASKRLLALFASCFSAAVAGSCESPHADCM